jgi:OST-HTH/LOTUS domain
MPARPSRRRSGGTVTEPASPTAPAAPVEPVAPVETTRAEDTAADEVSANGSDPDIAAVVTSTLAGLARAADGPVRASTLKRAILRKDPTFDEGDQGFRGFGELLRHLENRGALTLAPGTAAGDPEVAFPEDTSAEDEAFALFATTVRDLEASAGAPPQLSGLKDQMRKRDPGFSEKRYGFNGFLSFARAARARDLVTMDWDEGRGDYQLSVY